MGYKKNPLTNYQQYCVFYLMFCRHFSRQTTKCTDYGVQLKIELNFKRGKCHIQKIFCFFFKTQTCLISGICGGIAISGQEF